MMGMPMMGQGAPATISAPAMTTNNVGDVSDDGSSDSEGEAPARPARKVNTSTAPVLNGAAAKGEVDSDHEMADKADDVVVKKKEDDDKSKDAQRVQDRSRPVSSTPVPGTPW